MTTTTHLMMDLERIFSFFFACDPCLGYPEKVLNSRFKPQVQAWMRESWVVYGYPHAVEMSKDLTFRAGLSGPLFLLLLRQ